MKKSLRKTRSSSLKNQKVNKTVKAYSKKLSDEQFDQIASLFESYGKCKDLFFRRFCGINNMVNVKHWQKLRNMIRQEQKTAQVKLTEQFDFQGRHWVQALNQVCSNLNSLWSNLANQLKAQARDNDNLTEEERHYLNFCLSFREIWYAILKHDDNYIYDNLAKKYLKRYDEIKAELTLKQKQHTDSYIRRLTRRYKPYPHITSNHMMMLDDIMYLVKREDKVFAFASAKKGKRFRVELTGNWCYQTSGNLQLILDHNKKRLEIHKLIKAKKSQIADSNKVIGVDKGLATLLSASTEKEYGQNFSTKTRPHVEQVAQENTKRNCYIQSAKDLRHRISELDENMHKHGYSKSLQTKKKALSARLKKLEQNNLGSRNLNKHHNSYNAYLDSVINHTIKTMIEVEQPKLVVKEDLTFTKDKLPKTGSFYERKARRNLSSWTKGRLNERMEYQFEKYGIKTIDVNPAYTSQYCPDCGQHILERKGIHHEIAICPNCGKLNANTMAAKNILARKDDPEITLYTPYKKVKEILDVRAKQQTV